MKLNKGKLSRSLVAGLMIVGLAACSDSDNKQEQKAALEAAQEFSLLELVPADSPYVMVSSRRMPEGLSEKMIKAAAADLDNGNVRKMLAEAMKEDGANEKAQKLLDAILSEFEGKMNAEGFKSMGIPINGRSLVYGLGILPVAWAEIEDSAKVEALFSRIEEKSGTKAEKLTSGDMSYRRFALDDFVVVLGMNKKWLVLAMLPAKSEKELLPLAFGQAHPEKSLKDTGSYRTFVEKRHFLGYGDGYIDLVRLAEMSLGESEGINAQVLQAIGTSPKDMSPACRSFVKTTVQSVPLISFGFTEATNNKYTIKGTVETSPGVAAWLKKMAAPVPGIGMDSNAMFSFGMGLDLPQVRDGVKAMMRSFIENGKDCEIVDKDALTQTMQGMDMMLNPMFAGIKGFDIAVNNLEIDPQSMSPKAVDAQLLVASVDPKGMFGMLGMLNPQFAQIDVPVDGSPVKLPVETMAPMAPPTFAAIKGEVLALKVGDKAPAGIDKLLAAPVAEIPPMMALSYNPDKLFKAVAPGLKNMMQSMQGDDAEELKSAYQSLETAAAVYKYGEFRILGTDAGMTFESTAELK
ncbi:hypothetical protein [Thiolapillus brandeum]|uniref:DUF3352 domain-containing protein n=1 Tax=Thiolapillus brandeum TaxID=1076588 RepID=A0A7U6GKS7_9GAMM|nr:hypothetical protein [Thiolapillus brandeum]BAO45408.1 hypothetical protein TBH_C2500 [Thiolapillus brandeum]